MGLHFNQQASERIYRRMDRISAIDQSLRALRFERQRLVKENEVDEWLAQGERWRGKVVSFEAYRNNLRFRWRHQPTSHVA